MTGYLYRGNPALEELNAAIMAARRPPRPPSPGPPHGTVGAYRRHLRHGQQPCEACHAAKAADWAARGGGRRRKPRKAAA